MMRQLCSNIPLSRALEPQVSAPHACRRPRRAAGLLTLLIAGLSSTSCALVDREVLLDYSAPASAAAAPMAETVQPSVTAFVGRIEDLRSNTRRVGDVRNGFGMTTADVTAKGDAKEWVKEGLRTELQRGGFTLTDEPGLADYIVTARLRRTHCTAMATYLGEVQIEISATRSGRTVVEAELRGEGSAGMNWTATSESFADTLDLALQHAIIQFTDQLRQAAAARGPMTALLRGPPRAKGQAKPCRPS